MPREDGVMFTCNRCGKQEFVPFGPLPAKYNYEVKSKWVQVRTTNDEEEICLCAKCAEMYRNMVRAFVNTGN